MINFRLLSSLLLASTFHVQAAETRTCYSHGDPSPDEQYMLELLNRARANPAAEGSFLCDTGDAGIENAIRYFKVDLTRVRKEFENYPTRPPLAFSPFLMRSARAHSTDMANRNFQGHNSSDGTDFVSRLASSGYPYRSIGENVYSLHVPDTLFAHVGFNIDWGPGSGGVQAGVGHRLNMMNFSDNVFNEVGIGVIERSASNIQSHGTLSITQDFGSGIDPTVFLLGVVYSDRNANGICDPGEGRAGVTVSPSSGDSYAVTSTSGGYAIPFHSAASGVLTFSGRGLDEPTTRPFSISRENVKVDLVNNFSSLTEVRLDVLVRAASETGRQAKFRIRRSGSKEDALTVVLRCSNGHSRGKADFSDYKLAARGLLEAEGNPRNLRFTIPKGKSSIIVRLKAVNDHKNESNEKVTFKIKPTRNYLVAKDPSATIVIAR